MATLDYYNQNAKSFFSGTVDVDFSETRDRFLAHIPVGGRILDFGCGSGRDSRAFLEKGYSVEATDGSEEMCLLASQTAGIPVRCMLFGELDDVCVYDGIWACSSILHLPKAKLGDVLNRMSRALKPSGVIYTSFKYGTFEGERNGRYFTDFTEESFKEFLKTVEEISVSEYWITGDVRPGRGEERWLNLILTGSER